MYSKDLKQLVEAYQSIYEDITPVASNEPSEEEIKKAVAAALKITPDKVVVNNQQPNNVLANESSIALAVTIAGLIPPALSLVGDTINKARQMFGLSEKEKQQLAQLDNAIKQKEQVVNNLDTQNDPKEEQERSSLEQLKKQRDVQFGTKLGNMAKHAGHSLHHLYIIPIIKFLQSVAWTTEKFGKKTRLSDKKYRERLANIIYAVIMSSIAGVSVLSHLGHLAGVGLVVTTIADGVKAGKSIVDTIKEVALLI